MNKQRKQCDVFRKILTRFVENFTNKHWPCSAILDGSVNNNEHIHGFSDIDLKIFADSKIINEVFLKSVADSIKYSLRKEKITFNVWVLSNEDFPDKQDGVYFDFVRRFILKNGRLLFGKLNLETIKLKKEIDKTDRDLCIKTIVGFLIRLRRLLTNPAAISDVQKSNKYLLLQQGIAYYFHFLRYYNAFWGRVVLKIKDNVDLYTTNKLISRDQYNFAQKVFIMRNRWEKTLQTHDMTTAFVFLTEIAQHIEFVLDSCLRPNLDLKNQPIIYYP